MKNNTINEKSAVDLKAMISKNVEIADMFVRGKWLTALLTNGVYFSVLNYK